MALKESIHITFGHELQNLLFELKGAFNKIALLARKAQHELQEVNLAQEELEV